MVDVAGINWADAIVEERDAALLWSRGLLDLLFCILPAVLVHLYFILVGDDKNIYWHWRESRWAENKVESRQSYNYSGKCTGNTVVLAAGDHGRPSFGEGT
jgi:hypothetical protein